MEEIWKDVKGYGGYYQVSGFGRVKSLDREILKEGWIKCPIKGRVLKTRLNKEGGYSAVNLNKDGVCKTIYVHQLVAQAFLNHTIGGMEMVVNHINGIKTDNHVSNLEIVTFRENTTVKRISKWRELTSDHIGVSWDKHNKSWSCLITINGVQLSLGRFKDEEEAAKTYKKALSEVLDGTFNHESYKPKYLSKYTGVTLIRRSGRWQATIGHNQRYYSLGVYTDEIDAHQAYLLAKQQIANGAFLANRKDKKIISHNVK